MWIACLHWMQLKTGMSELLTSKVSFASQGSPFSNKKWASTRLATQQLRGQLLCWKANVYSTVSILKLQTENLQKWVLTISRCSWCHTLHLDWDSKNPTRFNEFLQLRIVLHNITWRSFAANEAEESPLQICSGITASKHQQWKERWLSPDSFHFHSTSFTVLAILRESRLIPSSHAHSKVWKAIKLVNRMVKARSAATWDASLGTSEAWQKLKMGPNRNKWLGSKGILANILISLSRLWVDLTCRVFESSFTGVWATQRDVQLCDHPGSQLKPGG